MLPLAFFAAAALRLEDDAVDLRVLVVDAGGADWKGFDEADFNADFNAEGPGPAVAVGLAMRDLVAADVVATETVD
jgi:hypothetical protein